MYNFYVDKALDKAECLKILKERKAEKGVELPLDIAVVEYPTLKVILQAYLRSNGACVNEVEDDDECDGKIDLYYISVIKGYDPIEGDESELAWAEDQYCDPMECEVDFYDEDWKWELENDMLETAEYWHFTKGYNYSEPNY